MNLIQILEAQSINSIDKRSDLELFCTNCKAVKLHKIKIGPSLWQDQFSDCLEISCSNCHGFGSIHHKVIYLVGYICAITINRNIIDDMVRIVINHNQREIFRVHKDTVNEFIQNRFLL